MGIFQQAAAGANLSPAARAFLKLIEGCVMAALVTVLPIFAQFLSGSNPDVMSALRLGAAAFATAFLLALSKYYKAHGDAPLGAVLDTAASDLRTVGGIPNDVKVEPTTPPDLPPGAPSVAALGLPEAA